MVLKAEHISLTLGEERNETLRDISLALDRKETALLAGPSGSGKTALGLALCGYLPHWTGSYELQGRIELLGEPITQGEWNPDAGIILENPWTQLSGLKSTVGQELAFPLECRGTNRTDIPRFISRYAEMFGMEELLPRRVHTLSGGELQRVLAACALISQPRFLFLDRPLTELDFDSRPKFLETIREHVTETEGAALLAEDPWLIPGAVFNRVFRLGKKNFTTENTEDTDKSGEKKKDIGEIIKRSTPGGDLLRVDGLEFGYIPDRPVLKDVSFSIGKGDIAFITGPNGAGKSTLARLLTGILRPWSGEILLEGTTYRQMQLRDIMYRVGYALQNAGLHLSRSTVREELALAEKWGQPPGPLPEILGIDRFRGTHPLELSQGERKHLALALAAGVNRRMVILDEPTQYQDEAGFHRTAEAIGHISGQDAAVILISHDPRLYEEFPEAGEIALEG
ncbi:MAG: ATP-binding cassette domain-containing protein [Candidatus Latescibacterota bacterium]